MNITVNFPDSRLPTPVIPPPVGYHIERVKRWGEDAQVVAELDVSTKIRLCGEPPRECGQFAVWEMIIYGLDPDDSAPRWIGDLSAITNFSRLNHSDVMRLANAQLLPFGYPRNMSDAEILAVHEKVLPDDSTLKQKMGWLINQDYGSGGKKPASPMWCDGLWYEVAEVRYGSMVNAGQLVAVSDEIFTVKAKLKNFETTGELFHPCHKLLPFRRAHWNTSHETHPYLLQHATVAQPNDRYGDYPRGHVICPVALSAEFDFTSNFVVTDYFSLVNWTVRV